MISLVLLPKPGVEHEPIRTDILSFSPCAEIWGMGAFATESMYMLTLAWAAALEYLRSDNGEDMCVIICPKGKLSELRPRGHHHHLRKRAMAHLIQTFF